VSNLGAFHLLDTYTNTVIDAHVSPAALAADLGVLGDREVLAE
jgi:hypothetical protein